MMDVKINKNRHRARNRTRASCDFNQRPHGFQRAGNFDFRYGSSSTSFQAQAAHFRFSPIPNISPRLHRSATKSADARRGAADDGELGQMPELTRGSPPISEA
jgi:hypothetical protein